MASVAEEKAPLTAKLGGDPEVRKKLESLGIAVDDGTHHRPPRRQQRREKVQTQNWRVQPQLQPQYAQPTDTPELRELEEQLQKAQLQLGIRQVKSQLDPPTESIWHKFLYGLGMLFATKVVDKMLEPKPVWRKHPGATAVVGVFAAGFIAFLGWKATRPLE